MKLYVISHLVQVVSTCEKIMYDSNFEFLLVRHKYSTLYKRYDENDDTSEDILKLTTVLIAANESNYTVW
jgi:hypothetical protein